ncbi:MAG: hypothetical protein ACREH4_01350 [Vitreimonas sp.]
MSAQIPYGPIERDLCRKAADDVCGAMHLTLALCETDAQRALVSMHGALAAVAACAGIQRVQWQEASDMDDFAIMRAVIGMIEATDREQKAAAE